MPEQKLYIGNLPYRTTEGDVRELFRHYGPVYSVILIYDSETGRTRGYGFVELEDTVAETVLRELNDTMFLGRNLKVRRATGKELAGGMQNARQARAANLTTPPAEEFGRGGAVIRGIERRALRGRFGEYGDFKSENFEGLNIHGKYYKIERNDYGLYHAYKFRDNQMNYSGPSNTTDG